MRLAFSSTSFIPLTRASSTFISRRPLHLIVGRAKSSSASSWAASVSPASPPVVASVASPESTNSPPTLSEERTPVRWKVRSVQDAPTDSILGRTLVVKGWVRTVRDQKQFAFVDVNDGSSLSGLQIVIDSGTPAFEVVPQLTTGCSIAATGEIILSPGKGQNVEMKATDVQVLGSCDDTYPLQKKRHTLEYLRSIAHLRPRTNTIGAVARVRSTLALATHEFFGTHGFLYMHSPIITASDCEGAGEMFRVTTAIPPDGAVEGIPVDKEGGSAVDFKKDFFEKPAYLTVSGQLSAETYACALSDVYTFGPTFRAENSNTSRHLAEFWMIEPEMAFASLEDVMGNAEMFIKHTVRKVLDSCAKDVEFFNKFIEKGIADKLSNVVDKPFARISYTEAVALLQKANTKNKKGKKKFEYDVEWGTDLQSEHERYLAEQHFKGPVFVYNYPKSIKAFYMRDNDDGEEGNEGRRTVQAMDLLVPGIGELIGGSAREERLEVLERKIEENGLEKEAYWWYLDLRKYGSVPHAGYGLGFERLVQFVTGVDNIRDTIPYPRYPGSAEF